MKRRNFFSKIAKCLLGIGIVTALPTPEVETTPEITPEYSYPLDVGVSEQIPQSYNVYTYTVKAGSPKGMVWDGKRYIFSENVDD